MWIWRTIELMSNGNSLTLSIESIDNLVKIVNTREREREKSFVKLQASKDQGQQTNMVQISSHFPVHLSWAQTLNPPK
jgi:hypothetical protein